MFSIILGIYILFKFSSKLKNFDFNIGKEGSFEIWRVLVYGLGFISSFKVRVC